MTLDDCWALVETAEKYGRHCQMMENCCYDRVELMTLNLVRKGVLGEVLHAEAGYLHDLREVKFSGEGEGLWRRARSHPCRGGAEVRAADRWRRRSSQVGVAGGGTVHRAARAGNQPPKDGTISAETNFLLSPITTTCSTK